MDVGQIEGGLKLDTTQWETPFNRMIAATARGSATLSASLLEAARESNVSLAAIAAQSAKTSTSIADLASSSRASMGMVHSSLSDVRLLMTGVDQSTAATAASMTRLERSATATVAGLTRLDDRLGDVERSMVRASNAANRTATASIEGFSDLRILLNAVDENILRMSNHMEGMAAIAARVNGGGSGRGGVTSGLANSALALGGVLGTVNPRIGQLVSGMTAVKGVSEHMGVTFGKATTIVAGAVIPLEAAKLAFNFTAEGVRLAADMEQVRISFETMIGSVAIAHKTLDDLKQFTDTTPFKFAEVAPAAKQLLAMGINAKDLVVTLRRLGDVSSGLSQPLGDIAYLYGKIKSEGVARELDLNEFARRGIPIFSELAKVMHVNENAVRDMVSASKVGFPEVQAAIESMTAAGGKFHDLTLKQSKSIKGELTTLADAWDKVQRTAGEALLQGGAAGKGIESLTASVNTLEPSAARFGAALRSGLEAAIPVAEKIANTLTDAIDYFSEHSAKKGMETATPAQPTTAGMSSLGRADVGRLSTIVNDLANARKRLGGGVTELADKNYDGHGNLLYGNVLSGPTKDLLAKSVSMAKQSGSIDAAIAATARLKEKAERGEQITGDEWAQARSAAESLGKEVDGFRQVLAKSKDEFALERSKYDSTWGVSTFQKLRLGLGGEQFVDHGSDIARQALDESAPYTSDVRRSLDAERQAQGAREAQTKQAQKDQAALAARAVTPGAATAAIAGTTRSEPVTAAAIAQAAADPNATPREQRAAATAAAKADRIATASAGRTADDLAAANVAELEALGQKLEADLAKVAATHAEQLRNAKTPAEEAAVNTRILAEQDAVRRRYADNAVKIAQRQDATIRRGEVAMARDIDKELHAHEVEARRAAKETADYQLEAQLTILRAYSRDFDATMLEAEHRYRERVDKATTEEEKLTAKIAFEATKREAIAKHRDDVEHRTGIRLPVTATANAQARLNAAKSSAQRALAEIDLREAKGGTLSAADQARRARLRAQTGTGADGLPTDSDPASEAAARARLKNAKTPAQRALAEIEVREARGDRLSASEIARRDRLREQLGVDPADRTSPGAAAAAAAKQSSSPPPATTSVTSAATTASAAARPSATVAAAASDSVAGRISVINAAKAAEQAALAKRYGPLLTAATASPTTSYQVGQAYAAEQAAIERKYGGPDASTGQTASAAARAASTRSSVPQNTAASAEASRAVAGLSAARGGSAAGGVNGPPANVNVTPLDAKELGHAIGDYLKPFVMREIREVQAAAKNAAWNDSVGGDL